MEEVMVPRGEARFRVTEVATQRSWMIAPGEPTMPGWNEHVMGWSLGSLGTGSVIEIDEPLDGFELAIFWASNHVILWGHRLEKDAALPEIGIQLDDEYRSVDPFQYSKEGQVDVRFDSHPLRIGGHAIECHRGLTQLVAQEEKEGRRTMLGWLRVVAFRRARGTRSGDS